MKRFGIQESGIGKKRADSLQQTADSERKAGREKRRGIFPLTSDPVRHPSTGSEQVLTALSRFDKLTTLSWPKGQSNGSPLKEEGD